MALIMSHVNMFGKIPKHPISWYCSKDPRSDWKSMCFLQNSTNSINKPDMDTSICGFHTNFKSFSSELNWTTTQPLWASPSAWRETCVASLTWCRSGACTSKDHLGKRFSTGSFTMKKSVSISLSIELEERLTLVQYETSSNSVFLPAVKISAMMRSLRSFVPRPQTGGRSWWSVWPTLTKSWERCFWRKKFPPMTTWRFVSFKSIWNLWCMVDSS